MGVFGSVQFTERPFEVRQGNLSELDLAVSLRCPVKDPTAAGKRTPFLVLALLVLIVIGLLRPFRAPRAADIAALANPAPECMYGRPIIISEAFFCLWKFSVWNR